jgi:hypothetical protein
MSALTVPVSVTEPASAASARPVVPWRAVLPFAVLLAFADGFWATSLRVAVGSIERSQTPFASWLLESTVLLPLFVLVVLGALVLASGWFGSRPRGRRLVATWLLVAAGGTLAGAAVLAANQVFDYRLQLAQVAMMGTMGGRCVGSCLLHQEHATFALQVRAFGAGSGILLLTNVLLVGWLLALQGGRWKLAAERRPRSGRPTDGVLRHLPRRATPASRTDELRLWSASGLLGAAIVHAFVVPEHLHEWPAAGAFFVLLTVAGVLGAGLVLDRPERAAWPVVAVLSLLPLAVWAWSRTVGMPFGPEAGSPEAVGMADVAACLLEVGTLALAVLMARAAGRDIGRDARANPRAGRFVVTAVVAVTVIGIGSTVGWFGDATPIGGTTGHQAHAGPVA